MKKITLAIALLSVGTYVSAQTNQIQSSGNVGIGTTTPTKELEVSGETKMDGDVEMTKDATVRENLKVDKNVTVTGASDFYGTTNLNGDTYIPNLNIAPINNNSIQNGYFLVQGGNGKLLKTSASSIGEIIYNPVLPCLSDANGNTLPIWKNGLNKMYLECPGNLGLGTTDPQYRLHVVGNGYITQNSYVKKNMFVDGYIKVGTSSIYIGNVNQGTTSNHISSDNGALYIQSNPQFGPYDTQLNQWGGKVIIGNASGNGNSGTPGVVLEVAGTVNSCKLIAQANGWCDYVFDDNYNLMSLDEVKSFISTYKHLPGVPSAKDVEESDVDVVEMEKILLKKVEELTLYMINMKEENDQLRKEVLELKKRLNK